MDLCKIPGCSKPIHVKKYGFCNAHYLQMRLKGDPLAADKAKAAMPTSCSVPGCLRPFHQKGYCRPHYMRWWRHGDPLAGNKERADKRVGNNYCGKSNCPGALRFRQHLHYEKNKNMYVERAVAQTAEKKREYGKRWKQKNGAMVLMHGRFRKRNLKQAMPAWLTEDQKSTMNAMYMEAQDLTKKTGVFFDVDHIFPLRGKWISGLHVPGNLRVITRDENNRRPRVFTSVEFVGLPDDETIKNLP